MENENVQKKRKPRKKKNTANQKLLLILGGVAAVLVILLVAMLLMLPGSEEEPVETTAPETTVQTEPATTAPTETEPVETTEPGPVMLENMAELYEQNPDVVGYVRIDNTKVDYPIMHTPDDESKYLHLSFEEEYAIGGLPFMDADCSMDPESDNLIFYGHNMLNGTQFGAIAQYEKKSYWQKHPYIYFSTLYEERTYEICAAFRDRIYKKYDDVFKFYEFVDYENEEEFNEAMAYFKKMTAYTMNVTPEYGDRFIMLVTCSYHHQYGRFVLVARDVTEELAAQAATEAAE